MKSKRVLSFLLSLCIIAWLFAGCKIETPDQAAGIFSSTRLSSADSSSSLNNGKQKGNNSSLTGSTSTANQQESANAFTDLSSSSSSENPDSLAPTTNTEQKTVPHTSSSSSSNNTTKDKYQTDSVPEGKPKPVEPQEQKPDKQTVKYCYLSVDCKTILNNMDKFNKNKLSVLPSDGIIFKKTKVVFYEGESVFDILNREMKKNRIHMEFRVTPVYNSNYIAGIRNLYEFDCGELSGWMYSVNGWYPNYGCSRYTVKEGDVIQWRYTCDLGRDVGCDWMAQTGK